MLDTNIPSELAKTVPAVGVVEWIAGQSLKTLYLSAISLGEFHKGVTVMAEGRRKAQLRAWLTTGLTPLFAGRVLPVTPAIAATAMEHGLILVTRNVRDFDGLGVAAVNPWEGE